MDVFRDTLRVASRTVTRASPRPGRSVVRLSMVWSAVSRGWSAVSKAA